VNSTFLRSEVQNRHIKGRRGKSAIFISRIQVFFIIINKLKKKKKTTEGYPSAKADGYNHPERLH
jgi:hypothetical protein